MAKRDEDIAVLLERTERQEKTLDSINDKLDSLGETYVTRRELNTFKGLLTAIAVGVSSLVTYLKQTKGL